MEADLASSSADGRTTRASELTGNPMSTAPATPTGITDESLAAAQRWVGVERPIRGWNSEASSDAIWHFAQGVGDDNPLYWEDAHGRRSRWGSRVAPPTWLYSCSSGGLWPGDDGIYPAHDLLPETSGLWAGDSWTFLRPVRLGDRIRTTATVEQLTERVTSRPGRSALFLERFRYRTAEDELLAECVRTIMRFDRRPSGPGSPPAGLEPAQYTEASRAAIAADYGAERGRRRGAEPRHVGHVGIGDELPPLLKGPLTLTSLAAWVMGWGSPLCQTNRLAATYFADHPGSELIDPVNGASDTMEAPHWNQGLAASAGMPRGYDFGSQRISWLAHLVTDWMGDDAELRSLSVRLRAPNLLGDLTRLTGSVTDVSADDGLVTVQIAATNQRGTATATGTAVVRLSA
jgi:acyl dehydratase